MIQSARRPKFRQHKGATWDSIPVILPDGRKVAGYVDTTWGAYVYFQNSVGKWQKVSVMGLDDNWIVDLRKVE